MNFYSERDVERFIADLEKKKKDILNKVNDLKVDFINLKGYFSQNKEEVENIFRCSKNLRDLGMLYQGIKRLVKIDFKLKEEVTEKKEKQIKNDDDLITGLSLFDYED